MPKEQEAFKKLRGKDSLERIGWLLDQPFFGISTVDKEKHVQKQCNPERSSVKYTHNGVFKSKLEPWKPLDATSCLFTCIEGEVSDNLWLRSKRTGDDDQMRNCRR